MRRRQGRRRGKDRTAELTDRTCFRKMYRTKFQNLDASRRKARSPMPSLLHMRAKRTSIWSGIGGDGDDGADGRDGRPVGRRSKQRAERRAAPSAGEAHAE